MGLKLICTVDSADGHRNQLSKIVTNEYDLGDGIVFVEQIYTDYTFTVMINDREVFLRAVSREAAIMEARARAEAVITT